MRQATFGWRFTKRFYFGLAAIAALAPPAWAYINGGTYHSTLKIFEGKLQVDGWGASFAAPLPRDPNRADKVAEGVSISPKDNPEFQRYVNQLVSRAVQSLPNRSADRVSLELKHEIAQLARDAIQTAVASNEQTVKQGLAGSLQYQVGAVAFESYWETNYGGKREIHAKRSRLAPFVALKIPDTKD